MMSTRFVTMFGIACVLASAAVAAIQQPADDGRRTGIMLMRTINTAEAAIHSKTGKYVELAQLVDHKMMGGVRADFATNGAFTFYQGRQVRLLLSPDGSQYQAMVVPVDSCGFAIFSDERGMIYTGKVLDCK
jgi:hypothetical protein